MSIHKKLFTSAILIIAAFSTICASPAFCISQKEFMALCQNGSVSDLAAVLNSPGISMTKVDDKGNTALMLAAMAKGEAANPEKIRLLVGAGADPNAKNRDSMRVIMVAAQSSDNPDVIAALVESGADLDERSSRGWTAMCFAAARNSNPSIVNALFDLGADINASDNDESTPLMLALRGKNSFSVVIALLDNGANPELQNKEKKKAIDYLDARKFSEEEQEILKERLQRKTSLSTLEPARFIELCRRGTLKRVEAFLSARTDPNTAVDGVTPLMAAAASNSNPDVVASLVRWGADENARDNNRRTPLIYAARYSHNPKVLEKLLLLGARADFFDVDGKTAFDYAVENSAYDAQDLLLLSSISKTIADAERRGIEIESARGGEKSSEEPQNPLLADLYRKTAKDQGEILRLTSLNTELKAKAEKANADAEDAQGRLQPFVLQTEEQKNLIDSLSAKIESLKSASEKDRGLSNENIGRLSSLWQSEMQRNLKLSSEIALVSSESRKQAADLSASLSAEREKSARLEADWAADKEAFVKEKASLEKSFAQEKAQINEAHRTEITALNQQIKLEQEEQLRLKELHASEVTQLQQNIIDIKADSAKAAKDAELRHNQEVSRLRIQYESDLDEVEAKAEEERAAEIRDTVDFLTKQGEEAILLEQKKHAAEILEIQSAHVNEMDAKLAELTRQKDIETAKLIEEMNANIAELKKKFDESLTSLNKALVAEKENLEKVNAEFSAYKERAALELAEARDKADKIQAEADTREAQKLAELDARLRAEFEVEKARLETEHRKELLNVTSALESKQSAEIRKLDEGYASKLEENSTALGAQLAHAQEQAKQEAEKARAVLADSDRALQEKGTSSLKAGIEQGRNESRTLFETAYSQSIKQAEARSERLLKENLAKQQIEHAASVEELNAKHRQELERAMANAEFQTQNALIEQAKRHEEELSSLRASFEKKWQEREETLNARHDQELELVKSANLQRDEKLFAELKSEYDKRTNDLLSKKDAVFNAQIAKLEAALAAAKGNL